jgi:DNA polymerase
VFRAVEATSPPGFVGGVMKNIEIDIETYSSVSLQKCGVYKYAESPDFEILLFGYSVDGSPVTTVDLACGEEIPEAVLDALTDDTVTKWAHNAQFERVCLSRYLSDRGISLDPFHDNHPLSRECARFLNPESWRCSMVWAAYMGLPLSLEGVGAVLGLEKQKLTEGKDLIRYFSVPCSPTKANGGRTRNLPEHDMEKWERYKAYNIRDVETEMQICEKLSKFPVPEEIWDEYHIDQEINDRGIRVDMPFVEQAIAVDELSRKRLTAAMKELTDLENPNSVSQMKEWLSGNGLETATLGKKAVAALIEETDGEVSEALSLRQQLAKSSVKKYQAMQNAACADDRCRGMFQFYGANRTGRFAGRLVQLQNLPQNHMTDLEQARSLVRLGDMDALDMLYDDIPDTLSQLIRTAFIPADGQKFYVADFSAIEARVIAWFAGEDWRTQVFQDGGDIYCASASQMFKVPVEKHGVNGHLRQKGKIAELALGYGGSVGALKAMGALDMGLAEEELQPLVNAWRQSNPHIVRFWWDVDSAVKKAIKEHQPQTVKGIKIYYQSGMLFILLPSGRRLAYVKPRMGENRFGGESVTYEGVGGTKKWERIESYGPKFVENIVQATSRDILMYAMKTLRCCSIVAHVHDELIIEADPKMSLEVLCEQMARVPPWAEGLLLRADGYVCDFYRKD